MIFDSLKDKIIKYFLDKKKAGSKLPTLRLFYKTKWLSPQ